MKRILLSAIALFFAGYLSAGEIAMDKEYFSWVDKLNLRDKPSLDSKVLYQFAEGEDLSYLGKKTSDTVTIELRGVKYTAPWVLVKSKTGKEGWVFAGAVKKKAEMEILTAKEKVYAEPNVKSIVLTECKKGEVVTYKGYQTDIKENFNVGGKTVQSVWVMVETSQGYKGWIPAPNMKNVIGGAPDMNQYDKPKTMSVDDFLKAVENAGDGSVITLKSGDYFLPETLLLQDKSDITIAGEGEVNIYIKDENANVMEIMNCGSVTLKNIKLKHYNPPKELMCTGVVIYGDNCGSLSLENCVIDGSGYWGLWLGGFDSVTAKNTKFVNHVDSSLELYSIGYIHFEKCEFKKNGGGINISDCAEYQFFDCVYSDKGAITINEVVFTREEFEKGIEYGYGD
ncbi:MAG: hypothetical protein A2Y33_05265 [Spirochaetes bacterium GWF1_51_8]|nr:MAG: hypothetical protein A2Y33_05265 [Spirochaetes bacterium GWF1_51_8]